MKIVLTGGGTGGHITPILALAHELKRLNPSVYIVYIGERYGKFAEMTAQNPDIDEIRTVHAGKLRRYHGESWLRRLVDVRTNFLNVRDLLYFFVGTLQSLVLMRRLKPDIVFLKGGFVGVPTGLAAAFWKIPFVTHDSDVLPGLANRLVARWAKLHATGMPPEYYGYPKKSMKYVGVLVSENHGPVSAKQQAAFKQQIGVPTDSTLLLVTGGSGGAEKINKAVRALLPELLEDYPNLYVVHQVGKGKTEVYNGYTHVRLKIAELLFPLYPYTGASDLVITRAGANAMAELGVQGRACIVIPNPLLTGGHQLKNAEKLAEQGAVRVVDESTLRNELTVLDKTIRELLRNEPERRHLGDRLQKMTIPDATHKLAMVLLEVIKH